MANEYLLKTGQINLASQSNPGSYYCVVIKNGEFHNLTEEIRQHLIEKLQPKKINTLEDMF